MAPKSPPLRTNAVRKHTIALLAVIGTAALLLPVLGPANLVLAASGAGRSTGATGKAESTLRIGNSVNVFVRYGYLSISMKVISYNDTERWLFKEPTNRVFQVSRKFEVCWAFLVYLSVIVAYIGILLE